MAETKRISRRVKKTDEMMMMMNKGLTDLKDLVAAQQLMELSNSSSTEESINSSSNNNNNNNIKNMKNHEERSIQNQKQEDNDGDENESEVVKVETHQIIRQMKMRKRFRSISDIYRRTRPLKV